MPRVKRSVHARKKRRKVLGQAKGYWGQKHTSYRKAKEQVEHSLVYAYRDRKQKKRVFRRLWILRINAAARGHGLSYNQFIAGLRKAEMPRTGPLATVKCCDPRKVSSDGRSRLVTSARTDSSRTCPTRSGLPGAVSET